MHFSTAFASLALLGASSVSAAPTSTPGQVVHIPMKRDHPSGHAKRGLGKTVESNRMGYYADIEVGTPPQNITVLLDTGSTDLWFVSKDCPEEYCLMKGRSTFDPAKSSTVHFSKRNETLAYGSAVTTGLWGKDVVSFGGFSAETPFLLVSNITSNGNTMPGLMGLALSPGSVPWWMTIKDQLAAREYSMFLGRTYDWYLDSDKLDQYDVDDNGELDERVEGAAQITFGGHDPELLDGEFNHVEVDLTNWWMTGLQGIRINGQAINIYSETFKSTQAAYFRGQPSAMIDSGASFLSVPRSVARQIMDHVPGATLKKEKMLDDEEEEWWIPVARSDTKPGHSLEVQFNGEWYQPYFIDYGNCVDLDDKERLQSEGLDEVIDLEYIRKSAPDAKEICKSTVAGSESSGVSGPQYTLGDPFMQTVYMKFSVEPFPHMGIGRLSAKALQMIDDTDAKHGQDIEEN